MRLSDYSRFTLRSLRSHRLRTALASLGIAVGIAAVILLTSIGEGVHQFVLAEFSQFGSNLISVAPGKVTTAGVSIGLFGTVRPLTIDDAEALRRGRFIEATDPVIHGNAEVVGNSRRRRITIYGMGPDWPTVGRINVALGSFLPREDPRTARPLAVLGSKAGQELFGDANPLGQRLEIGGSRFRVIGVMESKGQLLGMDLDDTVYIPAVRAQELFNRDDLSEIHVVYEAGAPVDRVVAEIRRILSTRHGRDDVTITTQEKMLDVLDSVLGVLTFAVGALGSISLLVGGVGILTIMTIAVRERTTEIGLLRALGATREQVAVLFLGEAALLSGLGGLAGLAGGVAIARLSRLLVPALPVRTPFEFAVLAVAVSVVIGLVAGVAPARQAARLEPVEALRSE
jgi:putative ABC transport system permease protein